MEDQVVLRGSLPKDVITKNIRTNIARGLPRPDFHSCSGPISVCGNGPSLREIYPNSGVVAALNGAWQALLQHGKRYPNYVVAYDPAPQNVAWFKDAPKGIHYLLGSRMDPAVFDMLKDHEVYIWHMYDQPELDCGQGPPIGGGGTVGTHAINLLAALGYTHFDLYGYDSCYGLDGAHHATDQDWDISPPKLFQVGERPFLAAPWMLSQVEWMLRQIRVNKNDYTVEVHDGGMLAACLEHNTLDVVYDLNVAPGSFDFIHSMFNVQHYMDQHNYARTRVHFRAGSDKGFRPNELIKIDHAGKQRMMNKVVRPLMEMFAVEEVGQPGPEPLEFEYSPQQSLARYRVTGHMPTFKPSRAARLWARERFSDRPIVITLRECSHWPQRNSDTYEWIRFANHIESPDRRVIFLRDTDMVGKGKFPFETCDEASLDLHKRLALYRSASMCFFVMNGPASLAYYTQDIPYATFFTSAPGYRCYDSVWLQRFLGIDPYGQFPWANLKKQRLMYADDDFETICQVYKQLSEK